LDIFAINKAGVINIVEVISPSQTVSQIVEKTTRMATELGKQGYTVVPTVIDIMGNFVK
jgi:hypothetical protein